MYARYRKPSPAQKAAVNELFKNLRKRGFVARQNFLCCGGCASAQLASEPKIEGKPVAYYHTQAGEFWAGERPSLMIMYGIAGLDLTDAQYIEVGQIISMEALRVGIPVKWNGDPSTCIELFPPEPEVSELREDLAVAIDRVFREA